MMDAPSVYPNGFHPTKLVTDRGGIRMVKTIPRYKAPGPIRYYYVDSKHWLLYEPDEERLAFVHEYAVSDIPEMSGVEFYDPFPADVFVLGNIFKKHFIPVRLLSIRFLSIPQR